MRAQGRHKAVHELLGGEIENFALTCGISRPGDGLQQMRLAQADAGMDVQWIEHHRVAAPGGRHLLGGGMGQRIGAADHEAVEAQAGVEWRAAERLMHARIADRHRPAVTIADSKTAAAIVAAGREFGLGLHRHGRAQHGRAHDQLDAADFRLFRLPAGQHALGIVRLDPALEETGRYRQAHGSLFDRFQVHAREPARIDVVTDLGAQAPFDPCPTLVFCVRHFFLALSD